MKKLIIALMMSYPLVGFTNGLFNDNITHDLCKNVTDKQLCVRKVIAQNCFIRAEANFTGRTVLGVQGIYRSREMNGDVWVLPNPQSISWVYEENTSVPKPDSWSKGTRKTRFNYDYGRPMTEDEKAIYDAGRLPGKERKRNYSAFSNALFYQNEVGIRYMKELRGEEVESVTDSEKTNAFMEVMDWFQNHGIHPMFLKAIKAQVRMYGVPAMFDQMSYYTPVKDRMVSYK